MGNKEKFLKRMFEYRAQYFVASVISFLVFCFWEYLLFVLGDKKLITESFLFLGVIGEPLFLIFAVFNTCTYIYSKYLVKKYGADLFGDLDQNWMKEHQGFDSSAFEEIFTRLIQCRKIAGPYILVIISLATLAHTGLATIVGLMSLIAYGLYRETYLDTAIADKVPRSMGVGVVVSRIIDREFTDKIDQLSKDLKQAKKE